MFSFSRIVWLFLVFLNGYVSLSLELVVLRYLGFWVGSGAVITSIIMGTFLGFMSLGYFLGASRRVRDAAIGKFLGVSFLVIAALTLVAASFPLITRYFGWMYSAGVQSGIVQTFIYSFALLSVGPFLFGFNTTLISRVVRGSNESNTGTIMAIDTIGSVLGSLVTTLFLMPIIGVNNTVIVICALACAGAMMSWRRWWVCIVSMLIIATCAYVNSNLYQRTHYGILVNNANSTIQVVSAGSGRILYMNSLPMSVYYPDAHMSAGYIEYVNSMFINTIPRDGEPKKILILGAGGFTAGLNDDFNDYTYVDIEPTLKDISENIFLGEKLGPNKKFVVQDASQFLKNTQTQYDLIMLDVYSNSYQVPESLIIAEFMERIKARVAPNGIVVMNMVTSPAFYDEYTRTFDNTFHAVFTSNTSRNVIDGFNPWVHIQGPAGTSNVIYVWYNRENDGRIYTIDKSSVLYDLY